MKKGEKTVHGCAPCSLSHRPSKEAIATHTTHSQHITYQKGVRRTAAPLRCMIARITTHFCLTSICHAQQHEHYNNDQAQTKQHRDYAHKIHRTLRLSLKRPLLVAEEGVSSSKIRYKQPLPSFGGNVGHCRLSSACP
jgi:hypothetical protein